MTVKELISKLSQLDQDKPILINDDHKDYEIDEIILVANEYYVIY